MLEPGANNVAVFPAVHVLHDRGLIAKVGAGLAEAKRRETVSLEDAYVGWSAEARARESKLSGSSLARQILSISVGATFGALFAWASRSTKRSALVPVDVRARAETRESRRPSTKDR